MLTLLVGSLGGKNRLLSHALHRYVLDPSGLSPLLRTVRAALFPNNQAGTSGLVAPASPAELRALRRRCANALGALLPTRPAVGRLYFGGGALWTTTGPAEDVSTATTPAAAPAGEAKSPPDDDALAEPVLAEIEHGILDVFGDAYCNKHLVYGLLELVLVRLLPELAEKGVTELWEERL